MMAIQIRVPLSATPNPTTLPRRIDFRQTLSSNIGEAVTVAFQMDAAHDVWFKDGNGQPSKTIQRTLNVSQVDQTILVRIALVTGPGNGPMDTIEIDEAITDASGATIPDSCELRLG
jgi:hypothetical protein